MRKGVYCKMLNLRQYPTIGRGKFTTVKQLDSASALVITTDPLKEIYTFDWLNADLFPRFEKIDTTRDLKTIYKTKLLQKVTKPSEQLNADSFAIYKILRDKLKNYIQPQNKYDGYTKLHDLFSSIESDDLRETMIDTLDSYANFTSALGFEISPRNVMRDGDKIILSDLFFDRKLNLKGVRS